MIRSAQQLLAERRAAVADLTRERNPVPRALLQYEIESIDRELANLRGRTDAALRQLRQAGLL